jgi:hypothetical protein
MATTFHPDQAPNQPERFYPDSFAAGVTCSTPKHYTAAKLNALLEANAPLFNQSGVCRDYDGAGRPLAYDFAARGAANGVNLYRLEYDVRVPETGAVERVSGLLAVPDLPATRFPAVSYQHGTLLDYDSAPSLALEPVSDPDNGLVKSGETLLNLARLAGNGYILIAADYLGKGFLPPRVPEAFAVKEATVETCLRMIDAADVALARLGLGRTPDQFFLNGWSQGALNTQWLLQALQQQGRPVTACALQSPFNDPVATFNWWCREERRDPNDPGRPIYWVAFGVMILLGSYRTWYRLPGLLEEAVNPPYLEVAHRFLEDYGSFDYLNSNNVDLFTCEGARLSGFTARELLRPGVLERFMGNDTSALMRCLAANQAFSWEYQMPIRFYYGTADEAIPPDLACKPLAFAGPLAAACEVTAADHRGTFLYSLFGKADRRDATVPRHLQANVLDWFNAFLKV